MATPWGHQTQSLLGSRYRSSLGTDGLRIDETATLATPGISHPLGQETSGQERLTLANPWGQSLLGSRYSPPLGHVASG
jgi:hypothetical protein